MQKRPFLLLPLLLVLAACGDTLSNMSREIPGWFNADNSSPRTAGPASVPPVVATTPQDSITRQPLPMGQPRPAKVALLVPLSGSNAALGKSFLDAAQMAVTDLGGEGFELFPKDTGSDSANAGHAAQGAIAAGAEMVIGPVFASSIPAVREKTRAAAIPVLSLSNDWNAAGAGVYVLGLNPAQQVARVLDYAVARGVRRIGILAPSSVYGDVAERTARQVQGAEIVFVQRYGAGTTAIKKAVEAVSAQRGHMQGLLIAEGGAPLTEIAKALTDVSLSSRDVQMMGTALWDDAGVASHNVFLGALYAAPEPGARSSFEARYEKAYGRKPARLASIAYDAVALAAVLARQGLRYDTAALTNPNGFAGLDGIFRLTLQGIAERGLAVMEVTQGGTNVIDPAPKRF